MSASETAVSLQSVNAGIRGKNILQKITLKIARGERVVIVGPNGSGKTSLLKTLTGFTEVTAGQVEVLGSSLATLKESELRSLRFRVGTVLQGLHLVARLSVMENVLIGRLFLNRKWLNWAGVFSPEDRERARETLRELGVLHVAERRADQISGGERQKVAIARALMQDPQILLADEPTSSLDPYAARKIADLLSAIANRRALTLITVLHSVELIPALGQRILGMKDGQIQFDQSLSALKDSTMEELYF